MKIGQVEIRKHVYEKNDGYDVVPRFEVCVGGEFAGYIWDDGHATLTGVRGGDHEFYLAGSYRGGE